VPSCPGWNIGQLVRHIGGVQRWAEEVVRTRAERPPPDDYARDLSAYTHEDPAVVGPWLAEGAARLADALRAAGPDAPMWTPVPGGTATFYARRFTHETTMHRADATLALDAPFTVDPLVAVDGIDEWMELGSLPMHFDLHPWMRELLGPGRTLHSHATDTPPDAAAEWLVDLTGDTITWRRSHEKAAVAVRGLVVDLLLLIYKRRPARSDGTESGGTESDGTESDGTEIIGDAGLLEFWLERVSFE
jgi:uncharacterized protein (TIGR03083 family)